MSTESRELPEYADLPPEIEPHVRYAHGALDRLKFATTSDARISDIHQAREGINAVLRYALAHSRAQDSGGEVVQFPKRIHILSPDNSLCLLATYDPPQLGYVTDYPFQLKPRAVEQPAKGEKWRCACGDLNYPNETCAMCNQSAPQPSDPADADDPFFTLDVLTGVAGIRKLTAIECSEMTDAQIKLRQLLTPPTAQRHGEGAS